MLSKIIMSVSLGLTLSTSLNPCFSMEEQEKKEAPRPIPQIQVITPSDLRALASQLPPNKKAAPYPTPPIQVMHPMDLMVLASEFYTQIFSTPDSQQKADQYRKAEEMVTMALSKMNSSHGESYFVSVQLKAKILQQQGILLHNLCDKKPFEETLDLFRRSTQLLRSSYDTYKSIEDAPNIKMTCEPLGTALERLSISSILCANKEKDSTKAISLCIESIESKRESDKIFPTKKNKVELYHILLPALHKMLRINFTTAEEFDTLCQIKEQTFQLYTKLIQNSNVTKRLLDFMDEYIIKSGLDFLLISETPLKGKKKGGKRTVNDSPLSAILSNLPSHMDPHTFIQLPWSIYCGTLRRASLTLAEVPAAPILKEKYTQKSTEHMIEAIKAYKINLYAGEYAESPEKEDAFILARLDDLIGNPETLNLFYRNLRRERKEKLHQLRVQAIKEEQRKGEEKPREGEKEKSLQVATEELSSSHLPSDASSFLFTPSSPAEPTKNEPQRKVKIKTRGKPSAQAIEKERRAEEEAREERAVSFDNYHVFHSLTGGIFNRNISLAQVKKLLKNLGCAITTGKGSHHKATAKNGRMWTIPNEWDGPIPHYYRQQLNHFLQFDMDINPEDIVKKG